MSGLEDLFAQIPTSDIASKIGVDEAEVNKAVQLLVPVLVGGLHENAQDPDHASKIESAADNHAASGGGGNSDLLKQLLPILAPIVLAYIGKQLTGKSGAPANEAASGGALNDVLGSILGGMGGNKSLGTVLGNVLGSKAGDILGGLFGGKK